jgi:hypothetical protein
VPEALAILAVFFVAIAIYLAMCLRTRDPALHDPAEEHARLRLHVTWLDERLAVARREQWGEEMVGRITEEREAAARELVKSSARAGLG